jgi:KAP family P-loop domain
MNGDNSSLKECWINFKRLVSNNPPFLRRVKEKLEAHDGVDNHKNLNYDNIKHQIDIFIRKNENLIFIVGPWGSGKTYLIEKYSHEIQEDGLHFIKKSFFGISSLSAAYIHLLGFFKTILFLFFIYVILYRFGFYTSMFLSPLFILLSLVLVTNRMNLTYSSYKFVSSFVDILITSGLHLAILTRKVLDMRDLRNYKHKVYVLDDLDHSSLKEEDRWALLANLWNYNTTYIVLLGYSENGRIKGKNKFEIIELCEKLEGKIIFLPIAWERNEEIMNHYLSQTFENSKLISPFHTPMWQNAFTPRELINIVDNFKNKFEEYQLRKKGYETIGEAFFNCILIRILIEKYSEKKNIDNENKVLLYKKTYNEISKDLIKFYISLAHFLSVIIYPIFSKINELNSSLSINYSNKENDELLKIIFLHNEDEMLNFFDETAQVWIDNNDKKALT